MPLVPVYSDDRHEPPRYVVMPDPPVRQAPQPPPKPVPQSPEEAALFAFDDEIAQMKAELAKLQETDVWDNPQAERRIATLEKKLRQAPAHRAALEQAVRQAKRRKEKATFLNLLPRRQAVAQEQAANQQELQTLRQQLELATRKEQQLRQSVLALSQEYKGVYQRLTETGLRDTEIASLLDEATAEYQQQQAKTKTQKTKGKTK